MINMIESRVLEHFWRQWEPQIIYVFHQTAPFPTRIWLPPFSEPVGLHAPPIMSREINMIGMAIAQGLDQRGQVGRHPHGHLLRRLVSGLRGLRAGVQEHPGVLDRDGGEPGSAARVHARTTCRRPIATCGRRACTRARGRPAGGASPMRWPTTRRRRSRRSSTRRSTRTRSSTTATRPAATRSRRGRRRAPFAYVDSAAAARSRRRRRDAPTPGVRRRARVAADGGGGHRRGRPIPSARGWCRPTRSSRRWRARCSTSRSTRTCASIRAGRRSGPYDAAGWTLPLQMGVQVAYATKPLEADVRGETDAARDAGRRRRGRRPRTT